MPTPKKLRLKGWLELEVLRDKITESKSTEEICENLYSYLTLIYGEKDWSKLEWDKVAEMFYAGQFLNSPTIKFPILYRGEYKKQDKPPWSYTERSWYMWANMLAAKYGWNLEYIAELEIDDALGLLQEIYTDEHLEKEWQWNLSELTYSYDTNTKTSKHQEYPWPSWMLPEPKPIKHVRIPKSLLPVGLIISYEPDNVKH